MKKGTDASARSACPCGKAVVLRLQFSEFQIGLSDGQTGMSGQGELLYMDVTFRRSGVKAYFKYGLKIGRSKRPFGYFWVSSKSFWPAGRLDINGMDASVRSTCFFLDSKFANN